MRVTRPFIVTFSSQYLNLRNELQYLAGWLVGALAVYVAWSDTSLLDQGQIDNQWAEDCFR